MGDSTLTEEHCKNQDPYHHPIIFCKVGIDLNSVRNISYLTISSA